jgi:Cu2+-exporting ATPase
MGVPLPSPLPHGDRDDGDIRLPDLSVARKEDEMKTINMELGGLFGALDHAAITKRLGAVKGVASVAMNAASASASVTFDEAVIDEAALRREIESCGFHCRGEAVPKHLCEAEVARDDHHGMHGHAGHAKPSKAAHSSHDEMSHDMGHGAGKDMQDMVRDMRNRFLISLVFTLPIFAMDPMGLTEPLFEPPFGIGMDKAMFVLASLAILYPAWPFLVASWRALRNGVLNMAVLVVLSVGTGYLFSVGSTFLFEGQQFYEAAAVLLVFILLGHWLEMRARAGASAAIRALLDLAPPKASVLRNGVEIEVPTSEVVLGDVVVLRPGNKLPVDGEVIEGESTIDESMLTGESMPVTKTVGDQEIGATINKSGTLKYRASKVGADTALAQIVKLVQEAQNSKAPSQLLADRASQWLVLAAVLVGLVTFGVWFWVLGQPLLFALTLTITVFVIACPDALGLATPMAVMVGTGLGASNGILFKNAAALEEATKLDVIVFDKTGTLTMGQPKVIDIVPDATMTADELLASTAAIEGNSDHPIALAIIERAGGLARPEVSHFLYMDGRGASAEIEGKRYLVGNLRLMQENNVALGDLGGRAEQLKGEGRTVTYVARDGRLAGLITVADAPRPNSAATIAKLHEQGVRVAMITGDNAGTAKRIAGQLGIDIVLADVLPGQKAEKIKELQAQGLKVGMVGDGVNDAPALTQADVGFAIGAGTDVAIESADVVLMKSEPYDVVGAMTLSKATLRKMHQNLWWAVGYNVIAFPLAAGVFYPFVLSPQVAALAMSGSSALVAINALMLKRTRLDGIRQARPPAASPRALTLETA